MKHQVRDATKETGKMAKDDKLPRGHAYIHMRNDGQTVHIDYPELNCDQAARMIQAIMKILKEEGLA